MNFLRNFLGSISRVLFGLSLTAGISLIIFQIVFFNNQNWSELIDTTSFSNFLSTDNITRIISRGTINSDIARPVAEQFANTEGIEPAFKEVVKNEVDDLIEYLKHETSNYELDFNLDPIKALSPNEQIANLIPDSLTGSELTGPNALAAEQATDQLKEIRDELWLIPRLLLIIAFVSLLLNLLVTLEPRLIILGQRIKGASYPQLTTAFILGAIYLSGRYLLKNNELPAGKETVNAFLDIFIRQTALITLAVAAVLLVTGWIIKTLAGRGYRT